MKTKKQWVNIFDPSPSARLRLFCFPFAGGGAVAFRDWSKALSREVEVCPVQLPGRGTRINEACFTRLQPLVETTAEGLLPYFDRPFAFFGHSFGAFLSFELTRHLRRQQLRQPLHLFASGCRAPQIPSPNSARHTLPEPVLRDLLRRFEGTPREILEQPEILALMLPILKADLEAHETYRYIDEPPLGCPISGYGGTDDPEVSLDQLQAWRAQTSAAFSLQMFHGGHFFINSSQPLVLRSLSKELRQLLECTR